jgi:hypothetical protein
VPSAFCKSIAREFQAFQTFQEKMKPKIVSSPSEAGQHAIKRRAPMPIGAVPARSTLTDLLLFLRLSIQKELCLRQCYGGCKLGRNEFFQATACWRGRVCFFIKSVSRLARAPLHAI